MFRRQDYLCVLLSLGLAGCGSRSSDSVSAVGDTLAQLGGSPAAAAESPAIQPAIPPRPPADKSTDKGASPAVPRKAAGKPAATPADGQPAKTAKATPTPAPALAPANAPAPSRPAPSGTATERTPAPTLAPANANPSAPSARPLQNRPAANDAEAIKGLWALVESQENGQATPMDGSTVYVFSAKELKIAGPKGAVSFSYVIEPNQNPKRIDLTETAHVRAGGAASPSGFPGIYALQGDALTLCVQTVAADLEDAKRPEQLKTAPGDHRQLFVLRRLRPSDTGSARPDDPRTAATEDETVRELRKCLADGQRLLETGKYVEFLEIFMTPKNREVAAPDRAALERLVEAHFKQVAPAIAGVLRATARKTPQFNDTRTLAVFDIRDIHVDGAPPKPAIRFVKVGDHWCLQEDHE